MGLALDLRYPIRWPFGILQLSEFTIGLLTLICCASTHATDAIGFIWFCAVSSLVTALVFLILYLLHIPETVTFIPWTLAELLSTGIWTVFNFIGGCVAASESSKWVNGTNTNLHSAAGAASFFCYLNMIVFGFHAFLLFKLWRGGTITTTTTTTSHTATEVRY